MLPAGQKQNSLSHQCRGWPRGRASHQGQGQSQQQCAAPHLLRGGMPGGARTGTKSQAPRCVARSMPAAREASRKQFPSWPAPPALAPIPSAAVLISVLQGVTAPPSPQARERPQAAHCGSIEGLEQGGEAAETNDNRKGRRRHRCGRKAGRTQDGPAARLPAWLRPTQTPPVRQQVATQGAGPVLGAQLPVDAWCRPGMGFCRACEQHRRGGRDQ